ncbi:hypothetical protein [uncultured Microbacterium sp.]|uniref:hypothetical protein n=1 Tax=uncultured Microbacterium sp. TaxID=191216 RepID=UPI0028D83412|nr:hypothetical protein [uncultured Microbacterium sp.]
MTDATVHPGADDANSLGLPLDEIREWGIVVRHLLAEHGAPILSTDDPRFASLGESRLARLVGGHFGALLAEDWFWHVFDQRPAFPWDGPAWSTRTPRYSPGGYEEVQVIFERRVESAGVIARAQLLVSVDFETGEVAVDQNVEVQTGRDGENDFWGSVEDARAHIAALSAVLDALGTSGGVVGD